MYITLLEQLAKIKGTFTDDLPGQFEQLPLTLTPEKFRWLQIYISLSGLATTNVWLDSLLQRYMWVEFVGSLLRSKRFFSDFGP